MNLSGWVHISAGSAINRLASKINNIILVGDELGTTSYPVKLAEAYRQIASDSGFFKKVVTYLIYAALCEEILQFTPSILAS